MPGSARKPVIHGGDHRPKGYLGPDDPGGADPLNWLSDQSLNLYGYGDLELAINNPGSLLAWYRFNYDAENPTGDALDSSGNSRTLTYHENTTGTADGESWDTDHEGIREEGAHPELGDNDDGSLFLQYDQAHKPYATDEDDVGSKIYPGAWFSRADSSLASWSTAKTMLGFIKVPSGGHTVIAQTLLASRGWNSVELGTQGWAIQYNSIDGKIYFSPGAAGAGDLASPGSLIKDTWVMFAIVREPTAWKLYLNGVLVDENDTSDGPTTGTGTVTLGNDRGTYGSFPTGGTGDAFFHGKMDEFAIYSVALTIADVQAIYAARGAGTGFGPTSTKIKLGGIAEPFSLSSQLDDTHNVDANKVAAADGDGGTYWLDIGGLTWIFGTGDPDDGDGSDGDVYVDTTTSEVWAKAGGVWVDQSYALPTGPPGETGPIAPRKLIVTFAGEIPDSPAQGDVYEAPYDADGSSFTFDLALAVARVEAPGGGDCLFTLQKASGGNVAFATPTSIVTVTVAAGDYRDQETISPAVPVSSGDLVSVDLVGVGATGSPYTVYLIGSE